LPAGTSELAIEPVVEEPGIGSIGASGPAGDSPWFGVAASGVSAAGGWNPLGGAAVAAALVVLGRDSSAFVSGGASNWALSGKVRSSAGDWTTSSPLGLGAGLDASDGGLGSALGEVDGGAVGAGWTNSVDRGELNVPSGGGGSVGHSGPPVVGA